MLPAILLAVQEWCSGCTLSRSHGAASGLVLGPRFGLCTAVGARVCAPAVAVGRRGVFRSVCSHLCSAFLVRPSVSATWWVPDVFWIRGLVGLSWNLPPVGFAFSMLPLSRNPWS